MERTGRALAGNVRRATSFRERLQGLLRTDDLSAGDALVFPRARQVHTVGMRYPIDVCFCDRRWRVVHVAPGLRPWRITRWVRGAYFVVEMRAGAMSSLEVGDQLSLEDRKDL